MKLSAIVITRNEESTIKRCLNSLKFADERIVVDSGSTDNTVIIARQCGAAVYSHPWQGFGAQKNFGAAQAKGPWLLFIDADEVVPPKLRRQIVAALKRPQADLYWLRITTIFLKRPLTHLYGHNPRLFKKTTAVWTDAAVHEQVSSRSGRTFKLGDDTSQVLTAPLLHYSHRTLISYKDKMHQYTSLDAQQMAKTGRHRSGRPVRPVPWLPPYLAARQFVKLYVYRRGFLDGFAGLVWCYLSARYEYEMASKYRSLTKKPKTPPQYKSPRENTSRNKQIKV